MLLAGCIAAAGLLFLIFKFGVRKVIHYDIMFDVLITGFLVYALAGTYAGMMAALMGGLMVSIILFIMKRTMRREVIAVIRTPNFPYRKLGWVTKSPHQ
tara:strand:+ start:180 stop:476 length:297 start_codon:yes stop_codon:yes gene_type:complete